MRFETRAIRSGQDPDPTTGSVNVPIYQTANFVFRDVGKPNAFEYSRTSNPTRKAFETCLACLEEGQFGLAFSSGMAAVDAAVSLVKPGEQIVSCKTIYGGTYRLFESVIRPRGIQIDYVDGTDPSAFERAVQPNTKMFWIETPANPLLQLVDVSAVAAIAKKRRVWLVADNTFCSPYVQRPLTQGADLIVHSTTKYIGGHSDLIGGAIVVNDPDLYSSLAFYQNAVGAVPGPFDCWLSLRGLKTLAIRMQRHQENALAIARFLQKHPKVKGLVYPGLASHPQHDLARRQMNGFGAMITFHLPDGLAAVQRFIKGLKVFLFAESLGGVESLICHPWTMSHGVVSPEDKIQMGIFESTLRLSIGIESLDDLLEDLAAALDRV